MKSWFFNLIAVSLVFVGIVSVIMIGSVRDVAEFREVQENFLLKDLLDYLPLAHEY